MKEKALVSNSFFLSPCQTCFLQVHQIEAFFFSLTEKAWMTEWIIIFIGETINLSNVVCIICLK